MATQAFFHKNMTIPEPFSFREGKCVSFMGQRGGEVKNTRCPPILIEVRRSHNGPS